MINHNIEQFLESVYNNVSQQHKSLYDSLKKTNSGLADTVKRSKFSIFYTNPFHTLKEGEIYYIGLNPGGNSDNVVFEEDTLSFFREKDNSFHCAYLDEVWNSPIKGGSPLQYRTKNLLEMIQSKVEGKQNIRDIFSTNINFFRSIDYNQLKQFDMLDSCLTYHKDFFYIVKPKIIVCNGNGENNSAYSVLREFFWIFTDEQKSFRRGYAIKWFRTENTSWNKNITVIGVPHMSRYALTDVFNKEIEKILDNYNLTQT